MTGEAVQQPAIHGDGMTVPHHPRLGPNGSFLHAAIAVLRAVEAGETAAVRTRPARSGDNPLRQPTVVQGALAAPTMVVQLRRQGKPRRRDITPNHRKPKRD
ncbi:MAG: hypothetical protein V3T02_03470 [Alphaproteobacteria bacterium]